MPKKIVVILLWLLTTGCALAPKAFETRPLSPQEAGELVLDATNTAAVVATQVQGSTATQAVRNDDLTATAAWFAVANLAADATNAAAVRTSTAEAQSRHEAATSTEQALQAVATQQASQATTEAQATRQANAQAEAALQLGEAQANGATIRFVVSAIVVGAVVALVLVVLASVVIKRMQTEVALQAQKIVAISQAMRETNAGTAVIGSNGEPVFFPKASVPLISDGQPAGELDSDAPPAPRVAIVRDTRGSHEVSVLSDEEKTAQNEMLQWIADSMAHYRAQGQPGTTAKQLVRWEKLQGWNGSRQKRARGYFGSALMADTTGTYSVAGLTLGELYQQVKFGSIKIILSVPGNTANEHERPEQARTAVVEGGR